MQTGNISGAVNRIRTRVQSSLSRENPSVPITDPVESRQAADLRYDVPVVMDSQAGNFNVPTTRSELNTPVVLSDGGSAELLSNAGAPFPIKSDVSNI